MLYMYIYHTCYICNICHAQHTYIYDIYIYPSTYLSMYLSVYLSTYLSIRRISFQPRFEILVYICVCIYIYIEREIYINQSWAAPSKNEITSVRHLPDSNDYLLFIFWYLVITTYIRSPCQPFWGSCLGFLLGFLFELVLGSPAWGSWGLCGEKAGCGLQDGSPL